MRRAKTELIVPIRDRRRHRRILTLKNFRNALFAIVAILAGITIYANLHNPKTEDYGRLYGAKIQSVAEVPKKPMVVQEAPIFDEATADPTLVVAQARGQILTGEADQASALGQRPAQTAAPQQQPLVAHDTESHLVVVGGPEGVAVVQRNSSQPVLGGGFGRH